MIYASENVGSKISNLSDNEIGMVDGGATVWLAAVAAASAAAVAVTVVWEAGVEAGEKIHDAIHPHHA